MPNWIMVPAGFDWGKCTVKRTCSSDKNPKFQVLTVYAPNGDVVEIVMRPRSTEINYQPAKPKGGRS